AYGRSRGREDRRTSLARRRDEACPRDIETGAPRHTCPGRSGGCVQTLPDDRRGRNDGGALRTMVDVFSGVFSSSWTASAPSTLRTTFSLALRSGDQITRAANVLIERRQGLRATAFGTLDRDDRATSARSPRHRVTDS